MPTIKTTIASKNIKIVSPIKPDIKPGIIEEPTEEQLEEETKKIIEAIDTEDKDQDQEDAKVIKEKLAEIKARTPRERKKESPANKYRKRKSYGKWPRPCHRCQKDFSPADIRARYCQPCGKIVAAEAGRDKGGQPPLLQEDVEERLRPFLRLGLNLKESCLEAELGYQTIVEKKKVWHWFAEFIERHKNFSIIKAKRAIYDAVSDKLHKENNSTAKWLLERRRSEEYGTKVEVKWNLNYTEELSEEKKLLLTELLARRWKKPRN